MPRAGFDTFSSLFLTRPPSAPAGGEPASRLGSLPQDLLSQAAVRVRTAAFVIAAVWALALAMNVLLSGEMDLPGTGGWPWPNVVFAGVGLAGSLGLGTVAGRLAHRPRLVVDLGLGFEVFTAAQVAMISFWVPEPHAARISWTCALILLYPAIAPSPPGKALLASLITASMDAVGMGIARARGLALDWTMIEIVWLLVPNYVCALLALVPTTLIRHLGQQVSAARELGSYRLGRLLGRGGMGDVHEATHRMIARPAAIKLIRPDLLADAPHLAATVVERFHREAEAVAALRSPHTVQLYDFGVAGDGTLYYAMELLDGLDLHHLVREHGPVPPERAIHILRQACDSLAEAHTRGLIHRDVKPSNIFVCRLGMSLDFVKVLDFGLVRHEAAGGRGDDLTKSALAPGTPSFMAPEVVKGIGTVDRRADVYALGCVAYWLLVGEDVFPGDNAVQVMYRHAYDDPPPPSTRCRQPVPADLERVILDTLVKDPAHRVPSADALAERLAACEDAGRWTPAAARAWWAAARPLSDSEPTALS